MQDSKTATTLPCENSDGNHDMEPKEVIDALPIDDAQKAKLYSIFHSYSAYHEGPLPPAKEFSNYEKSLPGSGNRILKMAEDINKAQISRITAQNKIALIQVWGALLLGIGILGITVYAISKGIKEGLWLIIAELVSMLAVYLGREHYKSKSSKEE